MGYDVPKIYTNDKSDHTGPNLDGERADTHAPNTRWMLVSKEGG